MRYHNHLYVFQHKEISKSGSPYLYALREWPFTKTQRG